MIEGKCRYPANRIPAYTGQKLSTALNKAPRSLTKKDFPLFADQRSWPPRQPEGAASVATCLSKERAQSHSQAVLAHHLWAGLHPGSIWKSRTCFREVRTSVRARYVPKRGAEPDPARGGPEQLRAIHPARKLRTTEGARPRGSLVRGHHVSPGLAAGPLAAGHAHLPHSLQAGGHALTSADRR